jgi:hypothetical protein
MKSITSRAGIFVTLALALGLASCLSSDAPTLAPADLTEPANFAGAYYATNFPEEKSNEAAIDGAVEAIGDRTFRLTLTEGDHKDEPILIRLLTLNDGKLLGVLSDPDPAKGAMYAIVTQASNGGWVFGVLDVPGVPGRSLRDALMRHGAQDVTYSSGNYEETHIKGSLSAANLRALFSDPDFAGALATTGGFRLSPKTSLTTGASL